MNIPQFQTFSLAGTLGAAEQIRGGQLRNRLGALALEQQKEAAQTRKRVKEAQAASDRAPDVIRQLREQGEHEAADALLASEQQKHRSSIQIIEGMQGWVSDQDTYDLVRSNLLQKGIIEPEDMPTEFDKSFFARKATEARGKLTTLERVVDVDPRTSVRTIEQVTQDAKGNILATSPRYQSREDLNAQRRAGESDRDYWLRMQAEKRRREKDERAAAEGEGLGLKASETNAIARQAAELHGGRYDISTGRFAFADDKKRIAAQQTIELAERILGEGRANTIGIAVTMAARELGQPIPETNIPNVGPPAPPRGANPLSIRGR